jgi:ABC-type Mn2+/Zn2+ transport system permease subunit
MQSKSLIRIVLITGLILLVPLIAMQFTDEVDWNLVDFVVMGALLFGTGLALEFTAKKLSNPVYRVIAGFTIVALFLLTWAELAVGIFGTPWAGS